MDTFRWVLLFIFLQEQISAERDTAWKWPRLKLPSRVWL